MAEKRKAKVEVEQEKCPMCGMERDKGEAIYECPRCGGEGMDCCVGGNNCTCVNCENGESGR